MRKNITLLVFTLALPAFAADPGVNSGPMDLDRQPAKRNADGNAASIRLDVNMTLVPVSVLDNYGRNVLGLQSGNFKISDGKRQVPIASFGQQDGPISVGLVFDASRSMTEKFKTARIAPGELYKHLNADDESFLITVADRAELRQDFTSDVAELKNSLLFANTAGATSLLDGIFMGLNHLRKARNPRKALIVVSDGGDNSSRYNLREILNMAVESDAQVYAIGLFNNPQTREEVDGPSLLSDICGKTGGFASVIRDVSQLSSAMAKIGTTLHNQYVLGFYPPGDLKDGKFRRIDVSLIVPSGVSQLKVFARPGYYAPSK